MLNNKLFDVFPVLETDRLLLRRFSRKDVPDYFRFYSDPDSMRYMDRPLLKSRAEAEKRISEYIAAFDKREGIYWALELKESGKYIGGSGFWRLIPEHYRAEVGYQLLPEYWRQGYSIEALRTIIPFGFNEMDLHSIEADVNPANAASIKMLEKLGFVREAYFKENYYFNGRFLDSAIYSLLTPNK